ncbi:MAG: hypothetical protein ACJAR2_001944 [Ilumatobacter sp.]|jgi:hypothetical protein
MRRFFDESCRVDPVRSGYITKMFDRMHDSNVPASGAAGLVALG